MRYLIATEYVENVNGWVRNIVWCVCMCLEKFAPIFMLGRLLSSDPILWDTRVQDLMKMIIKRAAVCLPKSYRTNWFFSRSHSLSLSLSGSFDLEPRWGIQSLHKRIFLHGIGSKVEGSLCRITYVLLYWRIPRYFGSANNAASRLFLSLVRWRANSNNRIKRIVQI